MLRVLAHGVMVTLLILVQSFTHAVQVGAGALAAPLEGVVIDELACRGMRPVAQRFRAEGTHHLRMAVVATFAGVDVAAGELQRGVGRVWSGP